MKLETFIIGALVVTAGCQRESADANKPKPAERVVAPRAAHRGPTPAEQTAGMVEATTQGKSQTPVGLKFDVLRKPVKGEPLEIELALLPRETAEPATIEVSAPEGLQVPATETRFEFESVEPAQVYRRSIRLTPTADGVFLLTLTVNLKHDQLAETRVFSVPLIVGATAEPPASSGNPPPTPPGSPSG